MNKPSLTIGAFGREVSELQTRLRALGFAVSEAEVTRGFFGPATRQAVLTFQKKQGLPTSGAVNDATSKAIAGAAPVPQSVSAAKLQASTSQKIASVQLPKTPVRAAPTPTPAAASKTAPPSVGQATALQFRGADLKGSILDNLKPGSPSASYISNTLNSVLKATLAAAATNAGQSVLANLLQAIPAIDIVAEKDLSLRDFVGKAVVLPADPAEKADAHAAIAKLSATTTVGDLLGLSSTIQANPILAPLVKQVGLSTLLKTSATLSSNAQLIDDFISRYAANQGQLSDFWSSLDQDPQFKTIVPELQLTFQLGTLTFDNPPLVAALRTRFPQMTSPQTLVSLSASDWEQLINTPNIAVPTSMSGTTPAEAAANYASAIVGTLKEAFPSAYFRQDLETAIKTSKDPVDPGVATFLNTAADFDILHSNINDYIAQHGPTVFQGIDPTRQTAVIRRIATWQRVAKVTTDFSTANTLLTAGFSSAYQIARTPRSTFLQKAGPVAAEKIYSKAQQIAAQAMSVHANLRQALTTALPRAIGSMNSDSNQPQSTLLPTWQSLFGPTSSCSCTDCRSVYSAAAYFVDLLQFLQNAQANSSGNTPLQVLLHRRPDLAYIKLNCVNTNTELPYVDLVNEILEGFIFINSGTLDKSVAHNTSNNATAAELSVTPEYTKAEAYNTLIASVYPPTLPYDRWLETARTYLNFTGTSLYEVMAACQTGANPADFTQGTPSGLALACEYLKVSEEECFILTGKGFKGQPPPSPTPLYQYYGYSSNTVGGKNVAVITNVALDNKIVTFTAVNSFVTGESVTIEGLTNATDLNGETLQVETASSTSFTAIFNHLPIASHSDSGTATANEWPWEQDLAQIETFLHNTAIAYADLVALLGTRALNPNLTILLQAPIGTPCDLTQTTIVDSSGSTSLPLQDTPTLNLMHRFIRLWKKLGWGISDLDKTMTALKATDIDQQFLVSLAAVIQLQTVLNLPLLRVLSFWNDLDTDGSSSLYISLFQNKSVLNPPDSAFQLVYVAPLAKAPTLEFPSPLFPNLVYGYIPGHLTLVTAVTLDELAQLYLVWVDPSGGYLPDGLYAQKAGTSLPLAALPAAQLPAGLIYNGSQVTYTGSMPDDFRAQLNFSSDPAYQRAVQAVYQMRNLGGTSVWDSPDPVISHHLNTILAALGISAQDLAAIRKYLGLIDLTPATLTPITLENLSALCRYAFLAQGLGVSMSDLATLIPLIGIDPLKNQDPVGTLRIVSTIRSILGSPFSVSQLSYLYLHIYDSNAGVAPLPANVSGLLTSLQAGLAGIVHSDTVLPDPKGDLLAKNLATLLGNKLAAEAIGLITGTGVYSAPLSSSTTLPTFPAGSGPITYDAPAQQLRFIGPMSSATATSLLTLSSDPGYKAAIANLHQQPIDFIAANLSSFLDPAVATKQIIETPKLFAADKIAYVTQGLMPYLQKIQSRSLIIQTLCDNLGLDPQLGGLLLNTVLNSQIPGKTHAMDDFLALLGDGLAAKYYQNNNLSGAPVLTRTDETVDFNWGFGFPDPSIQTRPFSVEWTAWVMPQYTENYTFYLMAGDGVRLWVDGQPLIDRWSDQMPTEALTGGDRPISLNAGQLYKIKLDHYEHTTSGIVQLSWSSPSTPKAVIPQTQLFSGAVIDSLDPITRAYTLLWKVNLLVSTFPLTAADVSYFVQHAVDFAGVDPTDPTNAAKALAFNLNLLPLAAALAIQSQVFNQWERLNAFVTLRNSIPGGDAGLLGIFVAASAGPTPGTLSASVEGATLAATGWNQADLEFLASSKGFTLSDAEFKNEIGTKGVGLIQLQTCEGLLGRLGISAEQLFSWGNFDSAGDPSSILHITAEQLIAADIQNTVKSKYDDSIWITVGKPLNDTIRQGSTDALIAYILANAARWGMQAPDDGQPITTADQLYEFFLIDVEMSTCMLTSRIVQASAAVQLFVQRSLLKLESASDQWSVSLSVSDATAWEWMKNFRVWQANRQVFFYPEDWMIPTLRDDKTPFFEDLESALLQNPISTDIVEQAYLDYLTTLDSVAQLDVRGTYWTLGTPSPTAPDGTADAVTDVLHVFARTTTAPYVYYYRRLLNCSTYGTTTGGAIWTPWEKVGTDIQGDHLVPVVWDGRLYLFWPTFAQSADPTAQTSTSFTSGTTYTAPPPIMDLSITLNWSEYQQGAWSSKSSSDPLLFQKFNEMYDSFTVLGASTLDTSAFMFNTSFPGDDSLAVNVYLSEPPLSQDVPTRGVAQVAHFTFSRCGGKPSSQAITPPLTRLDDNIIVPIDASSSLPAMNYYNSLMGEQVLELPLPPDPSGGVGGEPIQEQVVFYGLGLTIGIAPPLAPTKILRAAVVALSATPSAAQPWDLVFPQQFFDSFGLLLPYPQVPPVPDGAYLILPGQPFFYKDNQRSYFVTERFYGLSRPVSDANIESPVYSRVALAAATNIGNVDGVFANSANSPQSGSLAPLSGSLGTAAGGTPNVPIPMANTGQMNQGQSTAPSPIQFSTFFHPFTCAFIESINRYGLPQFLSLATQSLTNDNGVISGFVLSIPGTQVQTTPEVSAGLLIAQGELYEATASQLTPSPPVPPCYLYYTSIPSDGVTPPGSFYYNATQNPRTPGDAFIGKVYQSSSGSLAVSGPTMFEANYQPNLTYLTPYTFPLENVDFTPSGAYSIYNVELFFYIPWLIATQLSANQQFEEAQSWFNYIFNPTSSSSDNAPQRYWKYLPFYEVSQLPLGDTSYGALLPLLALGSQLLGQGVQDQINAWQKDPFNPFVIGRLRTIAFRMKIVMAYLDNLLAWGDNLFGQNTRESINEATQIYVLARDILGPRPIEIPARGVIQDYTYNDLVTLYGIDDLSNALVLIENDLPYVSGFGAPASPGLGAALSMSSIIPYFCLPSNDTLLGYWDMVDDRLYKIRHCMNLQGVVEQLPLFAPPISPALLVAAAAAGIDLSSVLNNTNAGTPFYRFRVMVQKALDLCSEVRSLGAALLAALEKQDAEKLSLIRATQETAVLQGMQQMKEYAVQEAQDTQASLQASQKTASDRQTYYLNLIKVGTIKEEVDQQKSLQNAGTLQDAASIVLMTAGSAYISPEFGFGASGWGGTPITSISFGGSNVAGTLNAAASVIQSYASHNINQASQSGLQAEWTRRNDEWGFQASQAGDEVIQIQDQINAAALRIQIAQEDQKNFVTQLQNAQKVQDFLSGKYTNAQLYSWMVDQISTVFFQCYQMAYDLATQAEAAFRFERCLTTSSFITFGYWDSLKKGLMSGERLYADIKRMELAFLQTDAREYEISKSISLVLFDPFALITLKETGQCLINLPESFFDMDYPGHYFRRVKTVSLTFPCMTGPYTSVNCTLTLLNSKIRVDTAASTPQDYANDAHFITNYAATQSIATSSGQNDSGMFEVNFHDERYLPFEGAGLISTWQIDMPTDCNEFDFETITDVVINVRYTARYGGDPLRNMARTVAVIPPRAAQSAPLNPILFKDQTNLQRLFSLRHEFPTEWRKFLNPPDTATTQSMQITLDNSRFPYRYRGKNIKISQAELVLLLRTEFQSDYTAPNVKPLVLKLGPASAPSSFTLSSTPFLNNAPYDVQKPAQPTRAAGTGPVSWILEADGADIANIDSNLRNPKPIDGSTYHAHLKPDAIEDILLLCQYSATTTP